jgi:hypothetical protein
MQILQTPTAITKSRGEMIEKFWIFRLLTSIADITWSQRQSRSKVPLPDSVSHDAPNNRIVI